MADKISQLPVDNGNVSHNEAHLVETFFKENTSKLTGIFSELKDSAVAGILFAILSLPVIDNLVQGDERSKVYYLLNIAKELMTFNNIGESLQMIRTDLYFDYTAYINITIKLIDVELFKILF